MQTRIQGTTMPVLDVQLDPNESVFSESGELSWMTASIQMTTHTQMGGGGGLFGSPQARGRRRKHLHDRVPRLSVSGRSFVCDQGAGAHCAGAGGAGAGVPGASARIFVRDGPQVTIGVGFQQSLGAGIFGGDGFLLQKLSGVGMAWLELSGELIVKNLAPGEMLRVHPGHVGAFQAFGVVPDHDGARNQEHDLRRRRAVSRRAGRTGNGVAADAAYFASGASDQ